MADVTTEPVLPTSSCCAPEAQTSCCEPSEKAACCDTAAAGRRCGCAAGRQPDIREAVRERYAEAARAAAAGEASSCGCGPVSTTNEEGDEVFGAVLYAAAEVDGAVATAVEASLGCGVPTAVADPTRARPPSTSAPAPGQTC